MAKHIRKEFQYDLPDEYLSNESTLGLKAQRTYDGPEKIWVFVDYKTNKILARESFREYDEENPEAQYEFLEVKNQYADSLVSVQVKRGADTIIVKTLIFDSNYDQKFVSSVKPIYVL